MLVNVEGSESSDKRSESSKWFLADFGEPRMISVLHKASLFGQLYNASLREGAREGVRRRVGSHSKFLKKGRFYCALEQRWEKTNYKK